MSRRLFLQFEQQNKFIIQYTMPEFSKYCQCRTVYGLYPEPLIPPDMMKEDDYFIDMFGMFSKIIN